MCSVHGVEYAFGAHDHATTGIFEVEPKQCPGFTFRKSILIGRTDLGPKEVRAFMEKLADEYSGNTYHLITKNCNHFCNDVCHRLTGKPIPRWVNRLARLGKNLISMQFRNALTLRDGLNIENIIYRNEYVFLLHMKSVEYTKDRPDHQPPILCSLFLASL